MKENKRIKYFLVTAKCGHVGKLKYVPVNFAVYAPSASEAAQLVKAFPRVKKHRKDSIINCAEITREQYLIQKDINRRDPYLKANCHSDVDMNEKFMDAIEQIERRERKEKRPLSMKYRAWKAEGRYLCKARCGGRTDED